MGGNLGFLLEIEGDVAKLLLDVLDDFPSCGGVKDITTLSQILDRVVGKITPRTVEAEDGAGEGETFVNGGGGGDAVTRVQDDTGGTTRSVEGQDCLNGYVESGGR